MATGREPGDMHWRLCGHVAGKSGMRRILFTVREKWASEAGLADIYAHWQAPDPASATGMRWCAVRWFEDHRAQRREAMAAAAAAILR